MGCIPSKPDSEPEATPSNIPGADAPAEDQSEALINPSTHTVLKDKPTSSLLDDINDLGPRLTKSTIRSTKQGGFSDVWLGTLAPDDIEVAIKCLRAIDVGHASLDSPQVQERLDKRLRREMNVWMPLEHPRILKCLGFAIVERMPSLVSPWCKNGNAQEYLKANPNCNREAMIAQVAEGLIYLHTREHPIVHYDVKLPNVMIGDDGGAMLTDFGVAKVVDQYKTGHTTTNKPATTLQYSSPEAAEGSDRNVKSDVYSFGCLVLEILSNQSPFYYLKSHPSIVMAKSKGTMPDPKAYPDLPDNNPIWGLLRKCWQKDAKDRPTMREVLGELHELGYQA